jgi:hypothetical protein
MNTPAHFPTLTADVIADRLRAARIRRNARRGVVTAQVATAQANSAERVRAGLPLFSR